MAAFEALYRAHAPPLLRRIIRPRVSSPADRDDVLVETFRSALEALPSYRWTGRGLFPWLARIATHKVYDIGRGRARAARAHEAVEAEPHEPPPPPDEVLLRSRDRATTRARVEEVLAALNPRYRRAIELRLHQELPRATCAEQLEVSIGTFDVVLLRSVRAFRREWAARFGEEVL